MGVPYSQWVFLSVIRIFDSGQEQNNTLRVGMDSDFDVTLAIPAGLYVLGLGGVGDTKGYGPYGTTEDLTVLGIESLFQAIRDASEAAGWDPGQFWLALDTGESQTPTFEKGPTGHVLGLVQDDDAFIYWGHAETKMDPAWFGVAKNAGTYPTSSLLSDEFTVFSQMSSTLVLVGQRVLGMEPQYESYKEVGVRAGDGSSSWKTLGDGVDEISNFQINVEGLPRASVDSGFHNLRRWSRQLRFNHARRRFFYIPDLATPDPTSDYPRAWDPNDVAENRRWGWRTLCVDPLKRYSFSDIRRHATSNREWQLDIPVVTFRE